MMSKIKSQVLDFLNDEEGASGIEYALIAAMVAVAIAAFVPSIKLAVTNIFTTIRTALTPTT